jgi:uncharacterized short protein YbdD (DUF466 family)
MRADEAGWVGWWQGQRSRAGSLASAVRQVLGMPDYQAYLRHLRQAHPTCQVPSPREFFDRYLEHRYGSGPTRCC